MLIKTTEKQEAFHLVIFFWFDLCLLDLKTKPREGWQQWHYHDYLNATTCTAFHEFISTKKSFTNNCVENRVINTVYI